MPLAALIAALTLPQPDVDQAIAQAIAIPYWDESDSQLTLPPPPPIVPTFGQQDDEFQAWSTWVAQQPDDTEFSYPPPPPSSLQDEDLEKWIAAIQFSVDDGQERSLPPTPPIATQSEEDMQRWFGGVALVDEGQESLLPPLPPFVPSQAWDDLDAMFPMQSNLSAFATQQESEYGAFTPPVVTSIFDTKVYAGASSDSAVTSGTAINVGGIG